MQIRSDSTAFEQSFQLRKKREESKAFQSKALFMLMEYAIPYLGNMLDQVLWFIDDGFHFFPSKARVQ
jgi:hypothetical protein